MSATPLPLEVIRECANIKQYVPDDVTFTEYINRALSDVKRYILNMRDIEWYHLFDETNNVYFGENEDNVKTAIRLMTISLIYKDNATDTENDPYWNLSVDYYKQSTTLLDRAKLEISITVEEAESALLQENSGQNFFRA